MSSVDSRTVEDHLVARVDALERAELIARQMLRLVIDGDPGGWNREDVLVGLGYALLLSARAVREIEPDNIAIVDETVMMLMGLLLDECSEHEEAA